MKKKVFLTEAKRKAIIADKEKTILESFAMIYNKIKRIDEDRLNGGRLNEFDRVFDTIFSMKPEYSYDEKDTTLLSPKYHNRRVTNGTTTAILHHDELDISFEMSITNEWEEDPDGPHCDMILSISYEVWYEDESMNEELLKFEGKELVNQNVINSEFISLLSDKTKEKLYNQQQVLIQKNEEWLNDGMSDY